METVVPKTYLKEGIETAERVAEKSSSLPILRTLLLSAKKDGVRISATDLQMGITYQFLGTTTKEGAVVFPGRPLSSLLAISPDERVSLATEGQALVVQTGSHHASLKTMNEEEFPIIPSLEGSEPFLELETRIFCKGLGQVVGMTGQSQTRPEIAGVFFVIEKKSVRLVATDSFRLAERRLLFETGGQATQNFILPQKTARELISILGEREGKTKLYFSPTQAVFVYEAAETPSRLMIHIVSRLIEGEYPNYEEVIPASHTTLLSVTKSEFSNHLKAAGIFAGKTQEVRLRATPQKNEVAFFSESKEAGTHQSTLKGEVTGAAGEIVFNWRFLLEGLAQIQGERVEFGLNGEDGPALLRSSGQEGYRYVIMPIKG